MSFVVLRLFESYLYRMRIGAWSDRREWLDGTMFMGRTIAGINQRHRPQVSSA
jgi:hypothetical protein